MTGRRVSWVVASGLLAASLLGGTPGTAASAATASGAALSRQEVKVIPAESPPYTPSDVLLYAGTTGYLHMRQGTSGVQWTNYADGSATSVPEISGPPSYQEVYYSGDAAALPTSLNSSGWIETFAVNQLPSGDPASYTSPSGEYLFGIGDDGSRALYENMSYEFELTALDPDGTQTQMPITGLPSEDHITSVGPPRGGGKLAEVDITKPGVDGTFPAVLDLQTGHAAEIPAPAGTNAYYTGSSVFVLSGSAGKATVYSAEGLYDGTDTAGQTVSFAGTVPAIDAGVAVIGDQLVYVGSADGNAPLSVYATPLGGASGPTALLHSVPSRSPWYELAASSSSLDRPVAFGADSLVAVGEDDSSGFGTYHLAAGPDGQLEMTKVLSLTPITPRTAALSMSYGTVNRVVEQQDFSGADVYQEYSHSLAEGYQGAAEGGPYGSVNVRAGGSCTGEPACLRTVADDVWGNIAFRSASDSDSTTFGFAGTWDRAQDDGAVSVPSAGAQLVDSAGGSYVVVDGGSPSVQYVLEATGGGQMKTLLTEPIAAAALSENKLWRPGTGAPAGTLVEQDLGSSTPAAAVRTITTGASCTPSELQAAQHWLYWSCGASGPAGVYDLTTGARLSLPQGPALLGDGYLLQHDASTGNLVLTPFAGDAVGASSLIANVPQGADPDDRGLTWTVDKTSGEIAYLDGTDAIHVTTSGVPNSPLTVLSSTLQSQVSSAQSTSTTGPVWQGTFNEPVGYWGLVVISKITGKVVYSTQYEPNPTTFSVGWRGKASPTGGYVQSGTYTVEIVASELPPGTDAPGWGQLPPVVASGTVHLSCAKAPFHSYDCGGLPALFGVHTTSAYTSGQTVAYRSNGSGGLRNEGAHVDWPMTKSGSQTYYTAVVPFGDFNGDRYGDFLARTPDGVLHAFEGTGTESVGPTSKSITIGKGWNTYNQLVSVGDVNGDGHDDLLARDGYGNLFLYEGTGTGHFEARDFIGSGWLTYTQIIGTGDLNGDGHPDFIAVDKSGNLWRYNGNGKGAFAHRVQIGHGFGIYNAVVGVGDLDQDGHNDFVARDASGRLWRYSGTGTGTFRARVQIGTGWNTFQHLL